ncbi:MAG: cupin domain-containing protein [Burkholderiales bacterium]|nr:cupin domain-containing protein [Burkholderiales bacterium]
MVAFNRCGAPRRFDQVAANILCGCIEFDRAARHPLVAALPPLIHIRGADASDFAWLQTAGCGDAGVNGAKAAGAFPSRGRACQA